MTTRLYIGNLSPDTNEDQITRAFNNFGGGILSVSIMTDQNTGKSKGFAYLAVEDGVARDIIDNMDGREFNGQTISVKQISQT